MAPVSALGGRGCHRRPRPATRPRVGGRVPAARTPCA